MKTARSEERVPFQGYRFIGKRFIKEINADCYHLEHERSGARILKIATGDPNKTFCIAFKTLPDSDNGAPHILEHSVLNGSEKFPVKSPFDLMHKGSLSTFMNAFTSKDFTMFPVASMNLKDYYNLMHVYLDAVFSPLILKDNRILKQEGWHYELTGKNRPVVTKGVVYNEMKGVFSTPIHELTYQVYRNLFPGHIYGFESGGYPSAIPSLSQASFIRFYHRYYHPDNSYIFLYGDADMGQELEFLDKEYLSKYKKRKLVTDIPDQAPPGKIQDKKGYYAVMDGTSPENQTFLSLNYIAGQGIDREQNMLLDLFCEVLVNQESAPVRLALQNAGIGKDVSAAADNLKQNVIRIVVQNANAGDKDRFVKIVSETLKEVVKKGVDRQEVQGVLNRMEFHLREGNDAQKGLSAIFQSQPGFFFANDPFSGLEYEKPLVKIKKGIAQKSLETNIRNFLLQNKNSLVYTLEPEAGLEKRKKEQHERELQTYKDKLGPDGIASLIRETRELVSYQQREDSPAALATVPMLGLGDINPVATFYPLTEKKVSGVPVLAYEQFTNKVVYVNFFFDLRVLPKEMIPYAGVLSNVLGLLDTEKYSYGKLNQQLNVHTGGFYSNIASFAGNQDDNNLLPKFQIATKSLNSKLGKVFELAGEILNRTKYDDYSRLKTILIRHQSQLESSIKERGNRYASIRLSSYFNNQGIFNELTAGLEYYWFVNKLLANFDKNKEKISSDLQKTASLLFRKGNLTSSVNCSPKDQGIFLSGLDPLLKDLPSGKVILAPWSFRLEKKNEGIETPSKVQYVSQGYNFRKLGYKWEGKLRVLDHVLSSEWLQQQVRVLGGAYGGYCSISPGGVLTLNSYRDPNLKETLDCFHKTIDYLAHFEADEKSMTRFIIGTIASLDHPMTNSQKGELATTLYFSGRTNEDLQRDRDSVLVTKPADIREYAGMIRDVLDQKAYCVYGNETKIRSEKKLFRKLIRIEG